MRNGVTTLRKPGNGPGPWCVRGRLKPYSVPNRSSLMEKAYFRFTGFTG